MKSEPGNLNDDCYLWSSRADVLNLQDLMPDDLRSSWCHTNRNKVPLSGEAEMWCAWMIPKSSPSHPGLWKNCLPPNWSLVPKKLGTPAVENVWLFLELKMEVWARKGEKEPHCVPQGMQHCLELVNNIQNVVYLLSCVWLFWDSKDCSPPASSVHGILQATILEQIAISFSRCASWPREWTCVSCVGRWVLYHWVMREAHSTFLQRRKLEEFFLPGLCNEVGFASCATLYLSDHNGSGGYFSLCCWSRICWMVWLQSDCNPSWWSLGLSLSCLSCLRWSLFPCPWLSSTFLSAWHLPHLGVTTQLWFVVVRTPLRGTEG